MDQPIINPPNPYIGVLRLFPGTLIRISGKPQPNAVKFAINFQTGPSINPRDDLALHLSPWFSPPPTIKRNSLINGRWGTEESWCNGNILNPHQQFEIMILNEPQAFKIAINGVHFCEFIHRIPYQQVTHLTIDGDVDISQIHVTSPSYQQAPPMMQQQPQPSCPYPTMPMPPLYPNLAGSTPNYPPSSAPPYSAPSQMPGIQGPMPTPAYGQQQPYQHSYQAGPMPGQPGPAPTPANYMSGYPTHPPQQHHGQSSGSSVLNTGLGALTGLGLGAAAGAAGAAIISAVNPFKPIKKLMKPKKFMHSGWSRSSSSSNSSISSRSSFSSNSS